jgi:hypothetical protein
MSGLYPIIRRARRPLVICDDDAGPPPAPAPAVPVVGTERPVNYTKSGLVAAKGRNGDNTGKGRKG